MSTDVLEIHFLHSGVVKICLPSENNGNIDKYHISPGRYEPRRPSSRFWRSSSEFSKVHHCAKSGQRDYVKMKIMPNETVLGYPFPSGLASRYNGAMI
jgi:hypothetical protein